MHPLVAAILAGAGGGVRLVATMTRGSGSGRVGYDEGNYGSLSPTSLSGQDVLHITTAGTAGGALVVRVDGQSLGQSFFRSISLSIGTFDTADADDYDPGGGIVGYTQWTWNSVGVVDSVEEVIFR